MRVRWAVYSKDTKERDWMKDDSRNIGIESGLCKNEGSVGDESRNKGCARVEVSEWGLC